MLKTSTLPMLTFTLLSAACGGSNHEANSAADVSADAELQATVEPGTEALAPTPISADPNSTQVTFDTVLMERCGLTEVKLYFPYDSAEVKGNGDERVRSMADCLVSGNLKGKELVLVGFTDPRGPAEYNKELGKSRAESIAELLVTAGMPKEKLVIKSAGERTASEDQEDWPSDRRVEIALLSD